MENVVFIYTTKCKSYFQFYFKNSIFHSLLEWLLVFKNLYRIDQKRRNLISKRKHKQKGGLLNGKSITALVQKSKKSSHR